MDFTNNDELLNELSLIANKAVDLRRRLTEAQYQAEKARIKARIFNQPNTNSLIDDSTKACMKSIIKDKICCVSGPMIYEFSSEQYNHILAMMGGSVGGNTGKIIERLIQDGQCIVSHKDVPISSEALQYIKIELSPNSVGCYTYTFDLENFLATPYFQNTLKVRLDQLSKTCDELGKQFYEPSLLKKL